MLKINYDKIKTNTGLDFSDSTAVYYYAASLIEFLATHNKNYTREQYRRIDTINEIINGIEEE